jgi:hypothetical protein
LNIDTREPVKEPSMSKEEKADESVVIRTGGTNLQIRSAALVRRGLESLLAVPQGSDVAFDEDDIVDAAIVGNSLFGMGIRSQADWTAEMTDLIGPEITPFLPKIWESAVIKHESEGHDVSDLPEWKAPEPNRPASSR